MLHLGQVEPAVDLVEQVLLDDGVHHDGNEEVEEDGRDVLEPGRVESNVHKVAGLDLHRDGHIVVDRNEDGGQRRRHLEHESHHENHGHTGDNIRVVLDDKLMAENRRILARLFPLDDHGCDLVP